MTTATLPPPAELSAERKAAITAEMDYREDEAERDIVRIMPWAAERAWEIIRDVCGGNGNKHWAWKLIELGYLLHLYQPLRICELGMGTTTAVFAAYVTSCHKRGVQCVDENLDYAAKVLEIVNGYRNWQLWLRTPSVVTSGDMRWYDLSDHERGEYGRDFLYVDGPDLGPAGDRRRYGADAALFAEMRAPKLIVFDQRYSSAVAFAESEAGKRYAIEWGSHIKQMPSECLRTMRYHTVCHRID